MYFIIIIIFVKIVHRKVSNILRMKNLFQQKEKAVSNKQQLISRVYELCGEGEKES